MIPFTSLCARLSAAVMLLAMPTFLPAAPFNSVTNGDWSVAGTWNSAPPAGGPGAADDATIDTGDSVAYDLSAPGTVNNVTTNGAGSLLTLEQSLTSNNNVNIHNNSTIDLGGNNLAGNIFDIGNFQGSGSIARTGGGTITATTLRTENGSNIALVSGDVITNLELQGFGGSSSVTTAATSNITNNVALSANASLILGADLVLAASIGTGLSGGGTIDMGGFNITTNGTSNKWWDQVTLLNRNLGGNLDFNGRLDLVRKVDIDLRPGDSLFTLETEGFQGHYADPTLTQSLGDTTGLSIEKNQEGGFGTGGLFLNSAGAANQSELTLIFDAGTPTGALMGDPSNFDWGLRWLGDHVTFLTNYVDNTDQLLITAPGTFSSADHIFYSDPGAGGDGYTYVGFQAAASPVPEPQTILLAALSLFGLLVSRRCRCLIHRG